MTRATRPTASTTPRAGRALKPSRLHSNAVVYFDAVRRHGSIREAARQLNMASSAVNRQILKLEQDVGLPLFERLPGGVRLTAAGEAFARHSILVLQDAERFAAEINQLVGVHAGHVAVAAAEGICTSVMPARHSCAEDACAAHHRVAAADGIAQDRRGGDGGRR